MAMVRSLLDGKNLFPKVVLPVAMEMVVRFIFLPITTCTPFLISDIKKKYLAENGVPGSGSLKTGRKGEDLIIKVPVGTIIKDADTGK